MHFDKLEARAPELRERALFKDLRAILRGSRPRAAALRKQLQGIKIDEIKTRADLAKIPVTRKSDLVQLQADDPPFGGLTAAKASGMRRLLVSPGPIFEPDGPRQGLVGRSAPLMPPASGAAISCSTPSPIILRRAATSRKCAAAIGCPVIPAGPGNTEQQLEAYQALSPARLLRHAGLPQDHSRQGR